MRKIILSILILLIAGYGYCQQLENPGFEEWESIGADEDEPVNWSSIKTSDTPSLNTLAPVVWGKSTDAHSGNYSLLLFNFYISLINNVAAGTITNGQVHSDFNPDNGYVFTNQDDEKWHTQFTKRPDSVVGWFKCNPVEGDFGTVKFLLHTGYSALPGIDNNNIAIAYYELPTEEATEWTRFSAPFIYTSDNNPEYVLSVITSGNGTDALAGSTALFDDFEFIYNPSSIDEITDDHFVVYQKNNKLVVNLKNNNSNSYTFTLFDILGKPISSSSIIDEESNHIDISDVVPGIYIAVATESNTKYAKKILIN
jgi:type IX secretion system substrate protein